jgi:hypothetical protein
MGSTTSPTALTSPFVPPDVAGVAELAELFDVDKDTILRWSKRPDFPMPTRLAAGPVWRTAEVVRWGAKFLPLPRGPRPKKGKRT